MKAIPTLPLEEQQLLPGLKPLSFVSIYTLRRVTIMFCQHNFTPKRYLSYLLDPPKIKEVNFKSLHGFYS